MRNHPTTEIDPALAETVRRLYVQPVDPGRARQDVATIAEAARMADQTRGPAVSARPASHARRRRVPLWRPALAAAAALVAVPGGMAAAGVQIPEPFDAPYRAVGISLPNQGEQSDEQSTRTTRGRSTQTPAATTPARTTTSQATPAAPSAASARQERAERRERAQRKARAERRRAARERQRNERRATPATPATPAEPAGKGGGAAMPATPARPAEPARPQERSMTTQGDRGPASRAERGLPRAAPGSKARSRLRDKAE